MEPMYGGLLEAAKQLYAQGAGEPAENAERLMSLEGLPMHCPEHHFIVPAALLLSAHRVLGSPAETVEKDLKTALARAKAVPGGFCGTCGCCGAAVGTGIFLNIWQKTTPLSNSGWSLGNRMTAEALQSVASVEGPRCCKRVTWLALEAAVEFCRRELSLDLGRCDRPRCGFCGRNRECRGRACPFFP